ncbi:proteasome assembly chaperone family protein [Microbacterium sp. Marseille-Q6965]|uniref:proteasome assembly chaperone family protein n=1 Tax=Microbacterium sp. Marseille-Q6965 TaxID=2965072 RepID=UPI0021B76091|nr:PAC2 family protein [Microbacterium sp. Marseille-Q6965]
MPPFGPLFERVANAPVVPAGLPMVVLMTGFTDAGGTVSGVIEYVREELDPRPLVQFSNDALLDYRARRPIVTFDQDHLTDYRPQRLELSLVRDALGQPFLVLAGYEPDFGWDAFATAVLDLSEEFEVSSVTWVHAIAMPVPHTRTLGVTVSGTRGDLIEAHSIWRPHTQVPATVGHLLEIRLSEAGATVTGFVLLVPHYLADTDYPGATAAALEKLMSSTGLVFALDDLREDDRDYVERVEEQISANEELQRMVRGLEDRYDAYAARLASGTAPSGTGTFDEAALPSADELAAELERYLASRPSDDDKGASS